MSLIFEIILRIKNMHPPIHYPEVRKQQFQERKPDIPLPSHTLQLLLRDPEVFPGSKGYIIPPVSSGSTSGPPPSRMRTENLQREATRRHRNQMSEPPQLTPSMQRSSSSTPSFFWMADLLNECYILYYWPAYLMIVWCIGDGRHQTACV